MSWTKEIWAQSLPVYNAILEQPFIKELADGSLDESRFARYLAQDEIYVGNYGRQMFELAAQMTDPEQKSFFEGFAQSGIESEKAMHQLLIDRFGINTVVEASKVTLSYNAHTQACVDSSNVAVGLAAMLPCAWIYNEVGLYILRTAQLDGNPYRDWIEEYGNPEFTEGVKALLEVIDKIAEASDEQTRSMMNEAYLEAAQFEYDFWEYGYTGE